MLPGALLTNVEIGAVTGAPCANYFCEMKGNRKGFERGFNSCPVGLLHAGFFVKSYKVYKK